MLELRQLSYLGTEGLVVHSLHFSWACVRTAYLVAFGPDTMESSI